MTVEGVVMKRSVRIIAFIMIVVMFSVSIVTPVYATEGRTTSTSRSVTKTVIGEYTEDTKDEFIDSILEKDPNALIFTSLDQYEAFLAGLENVSVSGESISKMRSDVISMHIALTIGVGLKINVYYDYSLTASSAISKIYSGAYSTLTGITSGVTYTQNRLGVNRNDATHILTDLSCTLRYYLILEGIGEYYSEDCRYQFLHDVTTGDVTCTRIQ